VVKAFWGVRTPAFLSLSASLSLCARFLLHGYGQGAVGIILLGKLCRRRSRCGLDIMGPTLRRSEALVE
jgi:hypothetical protein